MNYYNEFEPYAAQWLRNLIEAGLIPAGHVDTRSIIDVQPDDLAGYRQCHFFAGIGGWSLAARLAGWPDDRELWTGSAPCQPFSIAGQGKAQDDDRHLWPHFARLIRARRPAVVMGEQVAAAVGKDWLDGVFDDLEGIGYACGAAVVPACAVDAPHRRDRLWFVAHTDGERVAAGLPAAARGYEGVAGKPDDGRREHYGASERSEDRRDVADTYGLAGGQVHSVAGRCADRGGAREVVGSCGASDGAVADSDFTGPSQERQQRGGEFGRVGFDPRSRDSGHWCGAGWITGHDGKARRIESSIPLLAHGVSGRVAILRPGFEGRTEDPEALHWYSRIGALRAFGNAIVPQVAAEVIGAYMDRYPNG